MRAAVKFVFAAILAVLLLCAPVGACWDTARAEHPCCPKKPAPLAEDCARPGCVYLDTHVVVAVAAPVAELAPAVVVVERPAGAWVPVAALAPLALRQRVVLYRQLLI